MSEFSQTNQQLDPSLTPAPTELQMLGAIGSDGVLQALLSIAKALGGGTGVTGMIVEWPGAVAPLGWLLCDGSVLSRSLYPALFAICSTTYNTGGEAATDFRLPNRLGRVGVGKNGATFSALGAVGGEETHILTTAEMPAHAHTYPGSANIVGGAGFTAPVLNINTPSAGSTVGGGGAHNNLQPWIALNYIIKA